MLKCDGCNKEISEFEYRTMSSYRDGSVSSISICDDCYHKIISKIIEKMRVLEYSEIKDKDNFIEVVKEKLNKIHNIN